MKLTETEIMIKPVDTKKMAAHIRMILNDNSTETKYDIDKCGLVENLPVLTDDECCYTIIEKKLNNGKVAPLPEFPVTISHKTKGGWSIPMQASFYFTISADDLENDFLMSEISLKDFMGSRYKYNPRIEANTREMIAHLQSAIVTNRQMQ
jgi:hypothetical protein